MVHNDCKFEDYANSYDETMDIAKQKGGVSGEPINSIPNNYGGYDHHFTRLTKAGDPFDVYILEHMTGHPRYGLG